MLSRLSLTLVVLLFALAGCDREAPVEAQAGVVDRAQAGALMPSVNLTDPDGKMLNLGALQGEPVLVNLWATWCAPCVVEMPMLDDLADELDGKVRIVTVSQDLRGAERVVPFFEKRQFRNLEPWLDAENRLGLAIESGVMPTTVLYDAGGQEVWRVVGEYDWSSEEARVAVLEAVE